MSRKELKRLKKQNKNSGNETVDTSPEVYQRKRLDFRLEIRERKDYTERQKVVLETMQDKQTKCVMIDGFAGTSKTHCAVLSALKLLNAGKVKQIYYIRNPVEASANSKLGYIPGTAEEKMLVYAHPIMEKLDEFIQKDQGLRLIKEKWIECLPVGYLQGRSFNASAIIVDEAASMSWEDLMLVIGRCGEFTKIFFIGDSVNQLYMRGQSGFARFFDTFDDMECMENGIYAFKLQESSDIVRSGFVRFVMRKAGIIREDFAG